MAHVRGMLVRLKTKGNSSAGTDDHLYIGIFGKGGGREFPLDVRGFNDFEKGTDIKYWFGDVWEGAALGGAKNPHQSQVGGWNNPKYFGINLEQIDYVYLRKQGKPGTDDDDAYKLDEVEVALYGSNPNKRTFIKTGDIWLANEHGLQLWIPEG